LIPTPLDTRAAWKYLTAEPLFFLSILKTWSKQTHIFARAWQHGANIAKHRTGEQYLLLFYSSWQVNQLFSPPASYSNKNAGNAITQSFMTVPALLVDFPAQTSSNYATRATLLGRQWPYCWAVGNVFFRPISTLGALGYAYTSYAAYHSTITKTDWKVFTVAAVMHLITILHSAINMQPLNDKLAALDPAVKGVKDASGTRQMGVEALLRKWGKWNIVRVVTPIIAGCVAMWQLCL
jgi:Anthrone oxygenase